ncbi:MAG TPA: hypothetical protein VIC28_14030 [Thermoanaerobaculia bacterium]
MSISLTVVVSLPEGQEDINIDAAPVAFPHGRWTLYWSLVVDTPGLIAEFGDPGIILPPSSGLPAKVSVVSGPAADGDDWTAEFQSDVLSANAFNYEISIDWHLSTEEVTRNVTIHDPTISVTNDPPPGG